jgi:hypothetical protein
MKIYDSKKYFELSYRYLTYDKKYFGETAVTIKILEFLGVKKIILLGIYSFKYHVEKKGIIKNLIKRGHKFILLIRTYYRKYKE